MTPPPTHAELGELNTLLGRSLNTASTPQMRRFLYAAPPDGCGFPPQWIKDAGRNTNRLATDVGALLATYRKTKDRRVELALALSDKRTQLETLECRIDADGRIRCSVNITGTETQRHAAYKSNTGSGYNLHTTASGHKRLFIADDDHWMFSIDLSGADGWTIACECAALGDTAMLDDLRAGLKPAQAVALLYTHGQTVNHENRDRLKAMWREMAAEATGGWLYLACKRIIWATCYGAGEVKISEQILEDSYGLSGEPVFVEPRVCRALQTLVHSRYPGVKRRQERIRMLLARDGALTCANGSRRTFFGRKDDHATLKEAYAHHPQVMTTYVTSLAWRRLWYDPENWITGLGDTAGPAVQPLLLVHDSLVGQFPQARTGWACDKLREWFDNPVTIAGTTVTVPFSGGYGPSWGDLTAGTI